MTHETTGLEPTVGGLTKQDIEQELFESGPWGTIPLGQYETGHNFSEAWKADSVHAMNGLLLMLGVTLEQGAWADNISVVTTSHNDRDDDMDLKTERECIKESQVDPGDYLNALLEQDFDIESEPEDGDGWARMSLKLPDGRSVILSAQGYYWMERYYNNAAGEPAELKNYTEPELDRLEEAGAVTYVGNDIFWKINFAAESANYPHSAG